MRVGRRSGLVVMLIVAIGPASRGLGQAVDRIDPPSWWVERPDQVVMLLVEGSGLRGADVRVARGSIRVARVDPGDEGRALFVEVTVTGGATPGPCELAFASGGRTIRRGWETVARPGRRAEPFGPDDVIELVMPDRFCDGDPANNEPEPGDRLFDRRDRGCPDLS